MDELIQPLEDLVKEIKTKWSEFQQQDSVWEIWMAFINAVDWKEPWIIGLLCFHVLLLAAVILLRKNKPFQISTFCILVVSIYQSERLNGILQKNWRSFSKQPYFDPSGIFISVMLSGPFIFILLVMLICYLLEASSLLVELKRKQFAAEFRKRKNQDNGTEPKKEK